MAYLQTIIVIIMVAGALYYFVMQSLKKRSKKHSCGTCSGSEGCCDIKETIGIIKYNKK